MKILVIGENCKDRFIYCEALRFSPEAPVPVLTPLEIIENDGMSGNVVRNLIALNKNLDIIHWYQDELIVKTRFVEKKSNHMFIRYDEGEQKISSIDLSQDRLSELIDFDLVIVSDYYKGFLSDVDLETIAQNSRLSILDSKRKLSKSIVSKYTFVKLNEKESLQNSELLEYGNILTTLGSKGTKWQDEIFSSPNPQETIDVSGAGDTFTASFILKYVETQDIRQSIVWANKMASIVVSKRGVATP